MISRKDPSGPAAPKAQAPALDPALEQERKDIRAETRGLAERARRAGMHGEAYILDLASFDPFGKYWPPRNGPEAERLRLPRKPR